jgi:hypothetical protein
MQYCTIVKEQNIYQWILSDFIFDDGSVSYSSTRQTNGENDIKIYQVPTIFTENVIQIPQLSHTALYMFLKFSLIMAEVLVGAWTQSYLVYIRLASWPHCISNLSCFCYCNLFRAINLILLQVAEESSTNKSDNNGPGMYTSDFPRNRDSGEEIYNNNINIRRIIIHNYSMVQYTY